MDFPLFSLKSLNDSQMNPLPIEPAWILEGSPSARLASLARCPDGTTWLDLWDCTAGKFHWHYHLDEIAHIVDGEATITDADGIVSRIAAGDVVTFRHASRALWHVPHYIRKVAVMHRPLSAPLGIVMRFGDRARNFAGRLGRGIGKSSASGGILGAAVTDASEWLPLFAP